MLAVRAGRKSAAATFRPTLEHTGEGDDALRLQANLWSGNRDAAAVVLLARAGEASTVPRGLDAQHAAEQFFIARQRHRQPSRRTRKALSHAASGAYALAAKRSLRARRPVSRSSPPICRSPKPPTTHGMTGGVPARHCLGELKSPTSSMRPRTCQEPGQHWPPHPWPGPGSRCRPAVLILDSMVAGGEGRDCWKG